VPLSTGTRLGPYEIVTLIGAGGMGEVYRATDPKLKRQVAIKVLPTSLATDPERLARFQREAEVLAALNHPNIAHIHGLETSGGSIALVMELVEGRTLAECLTQGAIPVDEALPVAKQVADALEAAHEQGIIHRDLKPANIRVRDDGTVKVLDFGLAKALEAPAALNPSVTALPTITTPAMTELGVILGTAAYMAPEQAKGRPADKRSDIWAFGCVFYEMLTGKRAFAGEDVSDTLAAVLRGEPDASALPADVPEHIRLLLRRCLEKDRGKRISDISTARFLITEPLGASATGPIASRRPLWKRSTPFVVTAVATGATIGAVVWLAKPPAAPVPAPVARFSLLLAPGQFFTNPGRHVTAISPDGRQIAYVANQQVYLRELASTEARPIAGTTGGPGGVSSPTFSPDGRWLLFYSSADRGLKRIAVTGGVGATVCPADNPFGVWWDEEGIVFGQGAKGIFRVSPTGGPPEQLVGVEADEYADAPQMLPGGKVLFTVAKGSSADRWERAQIVVQAPKSRDRKIVIENGSGGQYVRTGHILYARNGVLYATRFDPISADVSGGSIPVLEGVRRATAVIGGSVFGSQANPTLTGEAQFRTSSTGTLVYVPGTTTAVSQAQDLALVDRSGALERLNLPSGAYAHARLSPDGRRVAFTLETGKDGNVFVYTLGNGTSMQPLTFAGVNRFPVWTGDGKRIAFQSDRDGDRGIFWQPADGSGPAHRLTKADEGTAHMPESWSPSGNELLYTVTRGSRVTLWVLSLRQERSSQFPDVESTAPIGSAFSPDGQWVAYGANGSVFVQSYPPTGEKHQVPSSAGTGTQHHPFWSRDGRELFYEPNINQLFALPIRTQPEFAFGTPASLPAGNFGSTNPAFPRNRDVDGTGKRFITPVLANDAEPGSVAGEIRVVLNWFQELKERVPTK